MGRTAMMWDSGKRGNDDDGRKTEPDSSGELHQFFTRLDIDRDKLNVCQSHIVGTLSTRSMAAVPLRSYLSGMVAG